MAFIIWGVSTVMTVSLPIKTTIAPQSGHGESATTPGRGRSHNKRYSA
jgi:hypothetical protein